MCIRDSNEHWATHPQVFARYARHYQSGAAMPEELQQKMRNASLFNKGYETVSYTHLEVATANYLMQRLYTDWV